MFPVFTDEMVDEYEEQATLEGGYGEVRAINPQPDMRTA